MLELLGLLGTYGPIIATLVPALVPVLNDLTEVAAATGGAPVSVPAFNLSWKGRHIEIGPIPIKLV